MGIALVVAAFAEVALITFQAAKGRHSHFNEATPLDGSIWIAMGVLMLANLIAAIFVIVDRQTDRVSTWTVRLGLVISTLGVASGGLMVTGVPGQTWAGDFAGPELGVRLSVSELGGRGGGPAGSPAGGLRPGRGPAGPPRRARP
ncbi:hypothetical protein AB0M44_34900 [Streptosporangium subroseum]|uniref:hypothetical protein n=1 Tax=Streptosporangium subroseum TaxID=106412 RepID=UPI0034332C11